MTAEKDIQHQIQLNNRGIVLANGGYTLIIYLKAIPFYLKILPANFDGYKQCHRLIGRYIPIS